MAKNNQLQVKDIQELNNGIKLDKQTNISNQELKRVNEFITHLSKNNIHIMTVNMLSKLLNIDVIKIAIMFTRMIPLPIKYQYNSIYNKDNITLFDNVDTIPINQNFKFEHDNKYQQLTKNSIIDIRILII